MPHANVARESSRFLRCSRIAVALALLGLAAPASAQWSQWGGPARDFRAPVKGLAKSWPEAGPKVLWERALGSGYSSIVGDGERVYTLVQRDARERLVALEARTGATVWEHELGSVEGNPPPNSTPLVVGERVYALGFGGLLCALDRKSGKPVWSHDLVTEYGAKSPQFGFAASPLALDSALILPIGGKGIGVAAFALEDGKLLWRAHDFEEFYASPLHIELDGKSEVVVLTPELLAGLDPATGALLWSTPALNEGGQNISTPVWSSDGLLCVTATTAGSIAFRLTKEDGQTRVQELWRNDQQISQTTVVRVGDFYLGSIGEPAQVTAFHAATGAIAWQKEGLSLANVLATDDALVLFDYDGTLALATATATGLELHARAKLMEPSAFTPPSLDGHTLYLRDNQRIVALDLGSAK